PRAPSVDELANLPRVFAVRRDESQLKNRSKSERSLAEDVLRYPLGFRQTRIWTHAIWVWVLWPDHAEVGVERREDLGGESLIRCRVNEYVLRAGTTTIECYG